MVRGLAALVSCQLAGGFVADALALPVPGTVLGMALLLVILLAGAARRRPEPTAAGAADRHVPRPTGIDRAADGLIRHLQLLFVPAGAGVILYLPDLARSWPPVLGGLVLGWLVTLLVSAAGAAAVLRWQDRRRRRPGTEGVA